MIASALIFLGCGREERRFSEIAPASGRAGGGTSSIEVRDAVHGRTRAPYETNAWAVSQGKQLYQAFNCVGCHAAGGGGMGPPLMDATWRYGSAPVDIYDSIAGGRPNGMPAYGDRVPDAQVWQLVAYVRSLSGNLRKDARPGRTDHMAIKPSEQTTLPEKPRPESSPPPRP
jgi:cytochrome c oxidase cbb3-type subunit III